MKPAVALLLLAVGSLPAAARAEEPARYTAVRIESNYEHVRLDPISAAPKTVPCGSPCVVQLRVGSS